MKKPLLTGALLYGCIVFAGSVFIVERAYAGENDGPIKWTLEMLNGQGLAAGNGALIPPVPLLSIPA